MYPRLDAGEAGSPETSIGTGKKKEKKEKNPALSGQGTREGARIDTFRK